MSEKKKINFREAEIGGFWSTANPNVFNGTINGEDVLLVRNVNKNNNSRFPEFRLYSKQAYNKLILEEKLMEQKSKSENVSEKTYKKVESEDLFILDIKDIDYSGGF